MKLRRQIAGLFVGPLAMVSGCALGPFNGLAQSDPVIALEPNSPLVALERSTRVQSDEADADGLRLAGWFRQSADSGDAEEQRQILLTGARRRMSQQMNQQMMMTLPLLMQGTPVQSGPIHQQGGQPAFSGPSFSSPSMGHYDETDLEMPQLAQPTQPIITPEMLQALTPQTPQRRGFRGFRGREETRAEAKTTREETAASTEADRIERTAKAEAERAEKAALAEATIAERRLQAEAELAERMTRAELELAERLATAKEDRDRRVALAREERELRMAILGIDPDELKTDPVDDALARIGGTKSKSDDSGSTRFTRFLRPRGGDEPVERVAEAAPRATKEAPRPTESIASAKPDSRDLVERSLDHSNELLDDPSVAEFASGRPAQYPSIVREEPRRDESGPALTAPEPTRDFDALIAKEQIDDGAAAPEDWSLLDDFLKERQAPANEVAAAPALEFPDFSAAEVPATAETPDTAVASTSPADWPTSAEATASPSVDSASHQKRPEDDLWILGQSAGGGSAAASPDLNGTTPAADEHSFPADAVATVPNPEAFTAPGGLFTRGTADDPAVAEAVSPPEVKSVATTAGSPPDFPTFAAGLPTATGDQLAGTTTNVPVSADPWVGQPAAEVASHAPPHFDWSQSAPESVDQVVHQPVPAPESAIHNATWVHQSLRDVCGPLPADLEALVIQLDIPEAGVRKEVLEDLARLGAKARPAAPAIRVLLDDSPLVAAHAAWSLWRIEANESQTVSELLRLMQTGDPETVQFTAYALGSMGPKALSAAPALRSERERFNGATRVHVAEALTRIDAFDQASVEVLMYGLQHPETHVRWLSALALGEVQPRYAEVVMTSLIGALKDTDPEVRSAAALTIGGFGKAAESAIPELQSRATLDAPSVQEAAQTALACIRK